MSKGFLLLENEILINFNLPYSFFWCITNCRINRNVDFSQQVEYPNTTTC